MKNSFLKLFNSENDFFKLANDAKRITHIALSSFILPVLFIIISILLNQNVLAPLFFGDPSFVSSSARQAFGLFGLFGTIIFFVFLWVKFFEGRSFRSLGFTKNKALKKYLFGFLAGFIMNSVVILLMAVLGSIEINQANTVTLSTTAFGSVLIFLLGYIVQGSSEEILFRGWIFQVIGTRYKPWMAALITTILFSLLHSNNDGINLIASFNLILFSLFLILIVLKDGSIWAACAWHTAWNWTLGNFYGLSVSGTNSNKSILNLKTIGNDLLSGGKFGPEGSIIVTIVLLTAITLTAIVILKKKNI